MALQQASEQQFQEWERLVNDGVAPFLASRMVKTTLRRLENGDAVRKHKVMELAKERQAALVEERTEAIVSRPDPPAAIFSAYQKANHPDYADRTQVEISGPDGGPILIEGKAIVGLADVVAFAREIGADDLLGLPGLGDPGRALPAASEVLPDPDEPLETAGLLPPAERS